VTARVESNQTNTAWRKKEAEGLRDVRAKAVLKEKWRAAPAAVAVMKRVS